MITAGVMGWPVAHSLSPRLYGYWLEKYGIEGEYRALAVPPEGLMAALKDLPGRGFAGVNLTVPHKVTALAALDEIDPLAQRIGAVNTVTVKADGGLVGGNSDGFGFLANLSSSAPDWRAGGGAALIIGAGGAARAVAAALTDAGVAQLILVNRTRSRAERLATDINAAIDIVAWEDRARALDGISLLVNTTTLGMTGAPPLELDLASLAPTVVVYDIVYAPLMTPLLTSARARGNPIVTGIGMLLHQARPGFAAWFGREPEVDDGLEAHVLAGVG